MIRFFAREVFGVILWTAVNLLLSGIMFGLLHGLGFDPSFETVTWFAVGTLWIGILIYEYRGWLQMKATLDEAYGNHPVAA